MKRLLVKGTVLDGNAMAASVLERLRMVVDARPAGVLPPRMAIILAGGNLASESYVRKKL